MTGENMDRCGNQLDAAAITVADGVTIRLTDYAHRQLIKRVLEEFIPHFAPGGTVLYIGDAGENCKYFDEAGLAALNVKVDTHLKIPAVIIYYPTKNWIFLIDTVAGNGPIKARRRSELAKLFASSTAGRIYISVFPDRADFARYSTKISWNTDVWIADSPTHMVHYR